jgi:hypothetical protein
MNYKQKVKFNIVVTIKSKIKAIIKTCFSYQDQWDMFFLRTFGKVYQIKGRYVSDDYG